MSRRIALPGADELFRSTGDGSRAAEARSADSLGATMGAVDRHDAGLEAVREVLRALPEPEDRRSTEQQDDGDGLEAAANAVRPSARRRSRSVADRRPTGRERHEEKITVYVSADELMDLEHARLGLRGDFGLPVDRGRVVREALAVVLADFEAKGEASILVRRLRGR